ncbi:MAG: mechanosensitive ion channel family protein [bacterium]
MSFNKVFDALSSVSTVLNYELFHLGNRAISLTSILIFLGIILFSWMLSGYLRRLFDQRLASQFQRGTDHTLKRLIHYTIIAIGLFIAVDFIGIDLTSLAVVASFLSVGIGFGMRNIASNFISGIILMIERPISVGDIVSVDEEIGRIITIGMRATVVRTVDNQEIVMPNSTFLEQNVINWTRGERKSRLRFSVGVAYGSDVDLVKETLIETAKSIESILEDPAPQVVFQGFGDSSLDFELRVWIADAEQRIQVRDELNTAINEVFVEKGIEMPFPQRDLHVRSPKPFEVESPRTVDEDT